MPKYQTDGAAAFDLHAIEEIHIWPGEIKVIRTGLEMAIQKEWEGRVSARGSTALRGLLVANAPGIVDCDYRGEVMVLIINQGVTQTIHPGDRIAQMVICRAPQARLIDVGLEELDSTERAAGRFGSTGR